MNLPSPQHYTVSERIELLAPHIRPSIHPPSRITFSFTSTHFLHLHACLDLSHLSAIFGTRCLILAIISISRRFIPSPPSRLLSRLGLINLLEHFERRRRNQTESLDYLIRFAHFSLSILITFLHDARFFFSPPFFIFISIFLVSCLLSAFCLSSSQCSTLFFSSSICPFSRRMFVRCPPEDFSFSLFIFFSPPFRPFCAFAFPCLYRRLN